MDNNEITPQNPFEFFENQAINFLSENAFGALLGRAGIGKTAFLVQLALNLLNSQKNVLHISLNDPVNKVSLWYEEVFAHLAERLEAKERKRLWHAILPHRFIMTFNAETFSVSKLERRLDDLMQQNIFSPHMIVMDGLDFNASISSTLEALRALSIKHRCNAWFSVRIHREDKNDPESLPVFLEPVMDMFEAILRLTPEGKEIHINVLKGNLPRLAQLPLVLDPSTMLLVQK